MNIDILTKIEKAGAQTEQPHAHTQQAGAQTEQPGAQTEQAGAQTEQPGSNVSYQSAYDSKTREGRLPPFQQARTSDNGETKNRTQSMVRAHAPIGQHSSSL